MIGNESNRQPDGQMQTAQSGASYAGLGESMIILGATGISVLWGTGVPLGVITVSLVLCKLEAAFSLRKRCKVAMRAFVVGESDPFQKHTSQRSV